MNKKMRQLDEISSKTLNNYLDRAKPDAEVKKYKFLDAVRLAAQKVPETTVPEWRDGIDNDPDVKKTGKAFRKRAGGIQRAGRLKKLREENEMIEELMIAIVEDKPNELMEHMERVMQEKITILVEDRQYRVSQNLLTEGDGIEDEDDDEDFDFDVDLDDIDSDSSEINKE